LLPQAGAELPIWSEAPKSEFSGAYVRRSNKVLKAWQKKSLPATLIQAFEPKKPETLPKPAALLHSPPVLLVQHLTECAMTTQHELLGS
jgi:hypothetical protein